MEIYNVQSIVRVLKMKRTGKISICIWKIICFSLAIILILSIFGCKWESTKDPLTELVVKADLIVQGTITAQKYETGRYVYTIFTLTVEKVLKSTTVRQVGTTVARELTRGLLGVLGLGGSSKKKKSWF